MSKKSGFPHLGRWRSGLMVFVIGLFAIAGAVSASAQTVYNAVPNTLAPNYPSLGF